jgi:small conductance mechanosensitive channel
MEGEIEKLQRIGDNIIMYGRDVVIALIILVGGLIATRLFIKYFRRFLQKFTGNQSFISIVSNSLHVVLVVLVVTAALHYVDVPAIIIRRVLFACILAAVGLIVIFRPYIPTLPYKVGNTIEVGGLVGKVEATTVLHTRLKTFDGKTLFIPNRMILNDVVNNYHFTPTRRIRVDVRISYHDDLLKAKQLLKEILADDSRVLEKPAPNAYVTNLGENGVELSARAWVENRNYLKARSNLLEKTKLRFDREGITIAFPQRRVHLNDRAAFSASSEDENVASEEKSDRSSSDVGEEG